MRFDAARRLRRLRVSAAEAGGRRGPCPSGKPSRFLARPMLIERVQDLVGQAAAPPAMIAARPDRTRDDLMSRS